MSQKELVPFLYRGFWDRPRMVVFAYNSKCYALDCPFDEVSDEYSSTYAIYELAPAALEGLPESWEDLTNGNRCLGEVGVMEVMFDPTFRAGISPSFLKEFISR